MMGRSTHEERRILSDYCASYDGCCGSQDWRTHVCTYHEGWLDGWDTAKRELLLREIDG